MAWRPSLTAPSDDVARQLASCCSETRSREAAHAVLMQMRRLQPVHLSPGVGMMSGASYLLVHPRLERRDHSDARRREDRFLTHLAVHLHGEAATLSTLDVSRGGLLLLAGAGALPPKDATLMLTVTLPDGPLTLLGTVVRYTVDHGRPAVGLKLLPMGRVPEQRWLAAIARCAEAHHAEHLEERDATTASQKPGQYCFVKKG